MLINQCVIFVTLKNKENFVSLSHTTTKFGLIHFDICRLIATLSIHRQKYFIKILDFNRFTWITTVLPPHFSDNMYVNEQHTVKTHTHT